MVGPLSMGRVEMSGQFQIQPVTYRLHVCSLYYTLLFGYARIIVKKRKTVNFDLDFALI